GVIDLSTEFRPLIEVIGGQDCRLVELRCRQWGDAVELELVELCRRSVEYGLDHVATDAHEALRPAANNSQRVAESRIGIGEKRLLRIEHRRAALQRGEASLQR